MSNFFVGNRRSVPIAPFVADGGANGSDRQLSLSMMSAHSVSGAAASARSAVQSIPIAVAHEFDDAKATFDFDGEVEGLPYPSLSPAQQDTFKADFRREVASLKQWSRREDWLPDDSADLQIFVSDEYKISRSLVPAAVDRRGRMEFPAWKAIAGEAAILHELVHVYFPNGNRLLAEGLAVFLQATIGRNPTFPNFGRPLHEMMRELAREMVPEFLPGQPESLKKICLTDLDKIATPSPLRLRVGRYLYDNTPVGQAHIYPIAGSFVQFLMETHGTNRFYALFVRTPLVPFRRDAGAPNRWMDVYGLSLTDLELQWKSMIVSCLPLTSDRSS
jgi:hypothetical protein